MTKGIILLLTGPNLDLLGQRQPELYGTADLASHVEVARKSANKHGFDLEHLQTAAESELITAVHEARNRCSAIVINAGAFTHYSWALGDALALFSGPIVELHISNPNRREEWRHISVVSPVATGSVMGFGVFGYELAVEAAARLVL